MTIKLPPRTPTSISISVRQRTDTPGGFELSFRHANYKQFAQCGRESGVTEVTMDQAIIPSVDELKGRWKRHLGAAKIAWGELTEDEILKIEGRQDKLAGAIQERYAITRDEADRQVKDFFAKLAP